MDGVRPAVSVVALVEISGKIFSLYRTYYLGLNNARRNIRRLHDQVTSLQGVLTNVADLAEALFRPRYLSQHSSFRYR